MFSAVRTRFESLVEVPLSLEVVYDNGPDPHEDAKTWARFSVKPGPSNLAELGDVRTYRTVGVAIASLYQPVETGDDEIQQIAKTIVPLFRGLTAGGVKYLVPSVTVVGRDRSWWQVNVTCPFRCDEHAT